MNFLESICVPWQHEKKKVKEEKKERRCITSAAAAAECTHAGTLHKALYLTVRVFGNVDFPKIPKKARTGIKDWSTYRGNGERKRRKREKGLNKKRAATAYQRQSSFILAATASFREIKTLKKATETRKRNLHGLRNSPIQRIPTHKRRICVRQEEEEEFAERKRMPPRGEERIHLQEGRKEGRSVLTCIPRPKKAEKTFIRPRSSADFPAPHHRRDHQDTKSFKFQKTKPGTRKNKPNKNLETDKRVSGGDNKRKRSLTLQIQCINFFVIKFCAEDFWITKDFFLHTKKQP
jgi:hypothetical protein